MVRKFATEHRTSFWQRFCLRRFFRVRFWRFSFPSSFFDLTRCLSAFISSHKHKWERYQIFISISTNNKHLPTPTYLYVKNHGKSNKLWLSNASSDLFSQDILEEFYPWHLGGCHQLPCHKASADLRQPHSSIQWGLEGDGGMVCVLEWGHRHCIHEFQKMNHAMKIGLGTKSFLHYTAGKCNKWKRLAAYTLKLRYRWIRSQNHKLWPFKPSWNYWN